ncbi:Uncharacterised protein [Providencia stuartii]|nr:Uncharacterised protein [Providencia stuartii]
MHHPLADGKPPALAEKHRLRLTLFCVAFDMEVVITRNLSVAMLVNALFAVPLNMSVIIVLNVHIHITLCVKIDFFVSGFVFKTQFIKPFAFMSTSFKGGTRFFVG